MQETGEEKIDLYDEMERLDIRKTDLEFKLMLARDAHNYDTADMEEELKKVERQLSETREKIKAEEKAKKEEKAKTEEIQDPLQPLPQSYVEATNAVGKRMSAEADPARYTQLESEYYSLVEEEQTASPARKIQIGIKKRTLRKQLVKLDQEFPDHSSKAKEFFERNGKDYDESLTAGINDANLIIKKYNDLDTAIKVAQTLGKTVSAKAYQEQKKLGEACANANKALAKINAIQQARSEINQAIEEERKRKDKKQQENGTR